MTIEEIKQNSWNTSSCHATNASIDEKHAEVQKVISES
jgi:hypothetical protein